MADPLNPINPFGSSTPAQGEKAQPNNILPKRLASLFTADGKPTDQAVANQQKLNNAIFGGGSLRNRSIFQQ